MYYIVSVSSVSLCTCVQCTVAT